MRFNFPLYQLTPTIVQIVIRREIAGEKEGHVARIDPRHVILYGGEIDLLDVLQHRRQRLADALIDFVSPTIQRVFGFCGSVLQLAKYVRNFFRHTKLAQIVCVRFEL